MRSLTTLSTAIYQKLGKNYSTLTERKNATKQYILNEITHWSIKTVNKDGGYLFKPKEFQGTDKSLPFEVGLKPAGPYPGMYELNFGDLNAATDKEMYIWDDKDPNRLQKALFLRKVLESKIGPMLKNGDISAIVFSAFNEDGLGEERYSYFYNMYSKLGKDKFDMQMIDNDTYVITKKNG